MAAPCGGQNRHPLGVDALSRHAVKQLLSRTAVHKKEDS